MNDWKSIGHIWKINSAGQVWSNKSNRLLKIRLRKDGYLDVKLNYKRFLIHRLVAIAFIPNPCKFMQVNHKDGNRSNSNAYNLEWCDQFANMEHAIRTGLFPSRKGIKNGRATINEAQAAEIKKLLSLGLDVRQISEKLDVSNHVVNNIKRNITWKDI